MAALRECLRTPTTRTGDLGGSASTAEVVAAMVTQLRRP